MKTRTFTSTFWLEGKHREHVHVVIDALAPAEENESNPKIVWHDRLILSSFLYSLDDIPGSKTEVEYLVRSFSVSDSTIYVVNEPVLGKEKAFVLSRHSSGALKTLERCVADWLWVLYRSTKETVSLIDGTQLGGEQ